MERLNSIYSKTYNFVYLRAKTIVKKEEDVQKLVKEVYLSAAERLRDLTDENLYEWLGKQTYILGCKKYRRKKVREAELIELEEQQYDADKTADREKTGEVICSALEELPDMYHATVFALYFDYMSIKDIAKVMDYSQEAIVNRLNYTHKYLQKALEIYQEENKEKVHFSAEAICYALEKWAEANCLNEMNAQAIYSSVCKELGLDVDAINFDERESSGGDKSVVYHDGDDMSALFQELKTYSNKRGMDKKQIATIGVVAIVGILLALAIVLFVTGKSDGKEKPKENQQVTEHDTNVDAEQSEAADEGVDVDTENDTDTEEDTVTNTTDEYVLPNSNTQKLSREDLRGLTKEQLRLARNEIFARYGVIFGVQDLHDYFITKSWYQPTISFDVFNETIEMSLIEEQNISLILQVEEELAE